MVASMVAGCDVRPPPVQEESNPEIQLEGVGLRFFRGNELRAVGRAAQATFRRSNGDLTAQSVRLRFLAALDRPEVEVAAREATGNLYSHVADAKGGVRIAQTAGAAGATEAASLDGKAQRASGTLPVDIVDEVYRIHAATGFVLNLANPGSLLLHGPVQTTVGGLR
ncbi:MAG: hypothetical protein QM765_46205 [Myxococcales bacterium]